MQKFTPLFEKIDGKMVFKWRKNEDDAIETEAKCEIKNSPIVVASVEDQRKQGLKDLKIKTKCWLGTCWKEVRGELWDHPKLIVGIGQWEISSETKNIHFQIYLLFKEPVTMRTCKNTVNDATWIPVEMADEDRFKAASYCCKDDTRLPHAEPLVNEKFNETEIEDSLVNSIEKMKLEPQWNDFLRKESHRWVRQLCKASARDKARMEEEQ